MQSHTIQVCSVAWKIFGYISKNCNGVQDIAIDYCSNIMKKAVDQSAQRGLRNIQPEDILFILRKVS